MGRMNILRNNLLLSASILLCSGNLFAFYSVDSIATSSAATGSSVAWPHTISREGTYLLVLTGQRAVADASRPVTSITYGNYSLAKIREDDAVTANMTTDIWELKNPPIGTNTVTVTFAGNILILAIGTSVSFFGVDLSSPVASSAGALQQTDAASPSSVSITTKQNDVFLVDVIYNQSASITAGANQVTLTDIDSVSASNDSVGVSTKLSTGSAKTDTMSWSYTANEVWATSVVALKPAFGKKPFLRQ